MKINILTFGIAKDIIGSRNMELELPEGSSVGYLKELLVASYPAFSDLKSLQVAVNEEFASNELILTAKDDIALIPPVSGG
jgi:molybdopterin synthase sulfur carrier subunit